ncbi:hypothetical protein [Ahrensia sp. R2A130]|uniref:hypothetical protein n=1 Tax=Ahrensia sp. R2A130 TaxID=744979 RepID=UPI0001E0B4FB|nr:hypothetical protein [Ahrensia sp. R2A130]EFL88265.1 serum amyloid A1 [Ahrensia sp. R2A130]
MIAAFRSWSRTIRIAIAVAAIAGLWGAKALYDASLRADGEKRITDRLQADDTNTIKEKAKRDAEIRDDTDDGLIDRLTGGVPRP